MKTKNLIFAVAELVIVIALVIILDWSEGNTQGNILLITTIGGLVWGIYERYGNMEKGKKIEEKERRIEMLEQKQAPQNSRD